MHLLTIRLVRHLPNRHWSPGVVPATDPTDPDVHRGGVAVTPPRVPASLLVTRAGSEAFRIRPPALKARAHTARSRSVNRWRDLRASLAGYCNDNPYRPEPGVGGGYTFWRCALHAGHPGMHRSRNYVWDADGRTQYLPLPAGQACQQPQDRANTPTRRQQRASAAWHRRRGAQHRIEWVDDSATA